MRRQSPATGSSERVGLGKCAGWLRGPGPLAVEDNLRQQLAGSVHAGMDFCTVEPGLELSQMQETRRV